ncbi:MAG: transcriptional regulator, MerR family [Clostridia bacterium]|jgi:DNA-binding transcriptional MerR regulator|nr:transcriptional regulator, MerR family [Clostridia bacterium]
MYTIKEISELTNLSGHTIRYYDREGLIPFLSRSSVGVRQFSDDDLEWLKLICCLKNSGMAIQKIKEFMLLCLSGPATLEERRKLLLDHKNYILDQMKNLEDNLSIVNHKIERYKEIGIFHIDKK